VAVPDCRFCAIVAGDEHSHVVYEDEGAIAFLDVRPLFPGHALLVPRRHVVTLPDLPADQLAPFFAAAQLLSRAIPEAMEKPGSFVAMNNVVSQSVPHLHVHVVPRRRKDGLRGFFWPRRKYESEKHMAEVAETLRATIRNLRTAARAERGRRVDS
jgi:histidine triad (HIT) family protein